MRNVIIALSVSISSAAVDVIYRDENAGSNERKKFAV